MVKFNRAFTLIELLVVISVISILSVILIRLLNIDWHRDTAEDSVRKSTIEKLAQGVEAYGASEGSYPLSTADTLLQEYVEFPTGYTYNYVNSTPPTYTIWTESALYDDVGDQYYIVYFSPSGKIRTCSDYTSPDDETSCDLGD